MEAMLLDERGDDFWALLSEGDEEGNDFVNLLPEGDIFTNFISEHDFPPDLLPEENDNRGALELHEDVIFSHNNHEIGLNKFSLRATRDIEAGEIVTELPVICLLWDPTNIQPIKAREKKTRYTNFLRTTFREEKLENYTKNVSKISNTGHTKFLQVFGGFKKEGVPQKGVKENPHFQMFVKAFNEKKWSYVWLFPDFFDSDRTKNQLAGWFAKNASSEFANVSCKFFIDDGYGCIRYIAEKKIMKGDEILYPESVVTKIDTDENRDSIERVVTRDI